jgi:hypothetical protein
MLPGAIAEMQLSQLNKLEQQPVAATRKVLMQHVKQQMLLLTAVLRHVAMRQHKHWRLEKLLSAVFWHATMWRQHCW